MIGWRVGWVVCPLQAAAIDAPDDGITHCTAIWQQRHDLLVQTLSPAFDVIPAAGGWSLLIDFARRGMSGAQASAALLQQGVAATSMENWGEADTARYLRLVFANEPIERLHDVAPRFARAFAQ
jgi:aspartate/methionine/tyrosine aminotransferase